MRSIKYSKGIHNIDWVISPNQEELIQQYLKPLKKRLAEEQAAKYHKYPDRYPCLAYVSDLLDEGVYEPYTGTVGDEEEFVFHIGEGSVYVQYSYMQQARIWLTEVPSIVTNKKYIVKPTSLGFIVWYQEDITDYEDW